MIWAERFIGVAVAILITCGLLLAAAYGPLYLLPTLRHIPLRWIPAPFHAAICLFLAWQLVRAYRTGSIRRRHLPPIERHNRPVAFWVYVSSYALLILMFGPIWALTKALGPI
jgi:hypothetical protein